MKHQNKKQEEQAFMEYVDRIKEEHKKEQEQEKKRKEEQTKKPVKSFLQIKQLF
jgi:hypothetical protein